jgi:hypothetical protein
LNDDGIGPLSQESRKSTFGLVWSADHHDWLYFRAGRSTGEQNFVKHGFREYRICGVSQYAHAPHRWQHIAEQFDTFSSQEGSRWRDSSCCNSNFCEPNQARKRVTCVGSNHGSGTHEAWKSPAPRHGSPDASVGGLTAKVGRRPSAMA